MLVAGTTSGDFFIFYVKSLTVIYTSTACGGGVQKLICKPMSIDPKIIESSLKSHLFAELIVAGGDGSISCWEYDETKECFAEIKKIKLPSSINTMSVSNDKSVTIAADKDGDIYALNHRIPDSVKLISSHETSGIQWAKFENGSSNQLVSCTDQGSLRSFSFYFILFIFFLNATASQNMQQMYICEFLFIVVLFAQTMEHR